MTGKYMIFESVLMPGVWITRLFNPLITLIRRIFFYTMARAKIGKLNPTVQLDGLLDVTGTGRITMGNYCRLGKMVQLETSDEGIITLGEKVRLNRGVTLVSYGSIDIGDNALIGEFTTIRDANHGYKINQLIRSQDHSVKPVRLGNDVWIGRGVCILPGVVIEDGAVIGANSVVTRNIPANAIAVGIPAKIIKMRE